MTVNVKEENIKTFAPITPKILASWHNQQDFANSIYDSINFVDIRFIGSSRLDFILVSRRRIMGKEISWYKLS